MTSFARARIGHGASVVRMPLMQLIEGTSATATQCDQEPSMTVIAMTREIGSLGTDVAAGIAKKLKLEIVQSEIVANNVAQRMKVPEDAVLRRVDGSASLLERWLLDKRKLSHYTSEEILGLAQQGNLLIRGWGAATLLREMPQVIGVRVCAPMDFRVRVMMKRLGSNKYNAVRGEIERFDAARSRAMRALFDIEHEDARLYHIVLNTERLSVDACVNAVCELAESARFRDHAKTRTALADKLLEAKVSSALAESISIAMAPLGVSVSVTNGTVTLAGTTTRGGLRAKVESIVHAIAGPSRIDNRILCVPSHGRLH